MICNTIHLYHKELQELISIPIINLKEELKDYLIKEDIKKAFIIGTRSTIKKGLYRFKEIKLLEPEDEEIKALSEAIFNFNKGFEKELQIKNVESICKKYINLGAEKVILGCTEFAVMFNKSDILNVNTIDILVNTAVNRYLENNFSLENSD